MTRLIASGPETDVGQVVSERTREWHFHIYFLLQSPVEHAAALALRDAVLTLRHKGKPPPFTRWHAHELKGAFVAVPLARVNTGPMGPHPAGSYEIWVPQESFSDVFFYLATNRGNLSVLIHPLTRYQRRDHESRNAWMGTPWPIYLDALPEDGETPLQYPQLELGWSLPIQDPTLAERAKAGQRIERLLADDPEAAPAPIATENA